MIQWFLKKLFGSRNDRALKKIRPLVSRINQLAEEYQKLTDDELKAFQEAVAPMYDSFLNAEQKAIVERVQALG